MLMSQRVFEAAPPLLRRAFYLLRRAFRSFSFSTFDLPSDSVEGEQSWAAPTKCWVRAAVALPECQRSNHFNVYVREAEAEAAAPTPLAVFRADLVAASFDLPFDSNLLDPGHSWWLSPPPLTHSRGGSADELKAAKGPGHRRGVQTGHA